MDKELPIIFRVDTKTGELFALFPTISVVVSGRLYCTVYDSYCGLGRADYQICINTSRPARAEEYAALKPKVESLRYGNLVVYQNPNDISPMPNPFDTQHQYHNKGDHHRERWLSVEELAAYLGVSKDTVYKWVAKGLPAYKVGRFWKFNRVEVDNWVRTGQAVNL